MPSMDVQPDLLKLVTDYGKTKPIPADVLLDLRDYAVAMLGRDVTDDDLVDAVLRHNDQIGL